MSQVYNLKHIENKIIITNEYNTEQLKEEKYNSKRNVKIKIIWNI